MLTLKPEFVARVVQMGLIPVVERIIEGRHAMVQKRLRLGAKKKRSGTTVSLGAGRMVEIEQRLLANPHWMHQLVEHFEVARSPPRILSVMGFSQHPEVASLLISKVHGSKLWAHNSDFVPLEWSR